MSLYLEFSASGPVPPEEPLVEAVGFGTFRLYEGGGCYRLPDVVLRTAPGVPRVRLLGVQPTQVHGVTGALQQLLMRSWLTNAQPAHEVLGQLDVVRNHRIPESVVRNSRLRAPPRRPRSRLRDLDVGVSRRERRGGAAV